MSAVIIGFPISAGGNHLRNIISLGYAISFDAARAYDSGLIVAHANGGYNMKSHEVDAAVLEQDRLHLLHGHFGEIMSFQSGIRQIKNKKFVLISPDTELDRAILSRRRANLGYDPLDAYFDGEQVFLYECFMYHYYFQVPLGDIMNISVSELFSQDISSVIDRLNYFLNISIDHSAANNYHSKWISKNNFKEGL